MIDTLGRSIIPLEIPMRDLEVGPCIDDTPTPEPTEIPTDTPTADTPTPTIGPSDTPTVPADTPTPEPTQTPGTYYAYLPITLVKVCSSLETASTDVILVIDASSSMDELSGGQKKIDAAKAAASTFLSLLNPELDQVGVVAFDESILLAFAPNSDLAAADAAISGIQPGSGTRIDLAIAEASQLLWIDHVNHADNRVIVLLTDGRPNAGTENAVLEAAQNAKSKPNTTLYTIGLGGDVDPDLLKQVASDGAYLDAPSADELESIYRELARDLPCPGGVVWEP